MPTSIATIPEDLFMKNLVPKQLKDRGSRLFSVTTGWYVCILIPCYVKYLLTAEKNPKLNSRFLIWVLRVLRTLLIHPHFSCSTQLWNLNASDECETTQVFSVTYLCKPEVDVLQEKNQKASPLGIFKSLLKALELCSDDKKKRNFGEVFHTDKQHYSVLGLINGPFSNELFWEKKSVSGHTMGTGHVSTKTGEIWRSCKQLTKKEFRMK